MRTRKEKKIIVTQMKKEDIYSIFSSGIEKPKMLNFPYSLLTHVEIKMGTDFYPQKILT
jgi:hypothetical protein